MASEWNVKNLARVYAMQGSMAYTLVHTSLSIAAEFSAWQVPTSNVEYAYCRRRIHIASSREALVRFYGPHSASNTKAIRMYGSTSHYAIYFHL